MKYIVMSTFLFVAFMTMAFVAKQRVFAFIIRRGHRLGGIFYLFVSR